MKPWHILATSLAIAAFPALVVYGLSSISEAQSGWTEPYVYDLAKEVSAAECTSRGCDLTPAINRSMSACEDELAETGNTDRHYTGCLFLLPAGDHTISETISVCRAHTFQGRGGRNRRSLTVITSPVGAFHGRGFGGVDFDAEVP